MLLLFLSVDCDSLSSVTSTDGSCIVSDVETCGGNGLSSFLKRLRKSIRIWGAQATTVAAVAAMLHQNTKLAPETKFCRDPI